MFTWNVKSARFCLPANVGMLAYFKRLVLVEYVEKGKRIARKYEASGR